MKTCLSLRCSVTRLIQQQQILSSIELSRRNKAIGKERRVNAFSISCRQYQDFLEDLEEDEAIRKNINIYRSKALSAMGLHVTRP